MGDISMQSNLEMFIRQWLEYVGRSYHGLVSLDEIRKLQNSPTIAITLTDSCAKSSVTVPITVEDLLLSLSKPSSQSQSSSTSNQNTSELSLLMSDGNHGWKINLDALDFLLTSLAESGGSLGDVTMTLQSGKLSLMIPKDRSPIS